MQDVLMENQFSIQNVLVENNFFKICQISVKIKTF